jgi:pentatricopeptide repeat protein
MFEGCDRREHEAYEVCHRSLYVRHFLLADAIQLIHPMPERNPIPYTVLLEGLFDASRVDEARKSFDEMPKRNVVSWTAMLFGYI